MRATNPASLTQIVRNPAILHGEPAVAGTRVPVRSIILTARYSECRDEVDTAWATLAPEQIDAAFAFYAANRTEIDRYIAENEAAAVADDW